MAKTKAEILITQSLIDRLANVEKWPTTRKDSESMYRKSLKRDVEWLLNTRQPLLPELEAYPVAAASVVNFGLPDIQGFNGSDGRDKNVLSASLLKPSGRLNPGSSSPGFICCARSDQPQPPLPHRGPDPSRTCRKRSRSTQCTS